MTATLVAGPPSCAAAASSIPEMNRAASASAGTATPPTSNGTPSPIRRVNCLATRSGSASARRSASSPTNTEPSGFAYTTVGRKADRDASGTILGAGFPPARHTATAEKVDPRSTPTWYDMDCPLS